MTYKRCNTCGEYDWSSSHRCPPEWDCRMAEDGEDDWQTVRARTSETAATKFAERYDSEADYYILGSRGRKDAVVLVRGPTGKVQRFAITAEAIPTYYARELMSIEEASK